MATPGTPATSLDEASILAEARARAGLVDFGGEEFREPLRRMLHAFETEAQLNEAGRVAQRERTIGLLVNRLRIEDWLRRHPEILDEKIGAPIVIAGLPRCCTGSSRATRGSTPGSGTSCATRRPSRGATGRATTRASPTPRSR
jgi:hypothetical protein